MSGPQRVVGHGRVASTLIATFVLVLGVASIVALSRRDGVPTDLSELGLAGSAPAGSTPAGSTPPGSTPPGSTPPGSIPPGSIPPGSTPVGSAPRARPPATTALPTTPTSLDPDAAGRVVTALEQTMAAGTIHLRYQMRTNAPRAGHVVAGSFAGDGVFTIVPKTMDFSVAISSLGPKVLIHIEGDRVWANSDAPTGTGQPLSRFASTVQGTAGMRAGSLAMTMVASPGGYLAIGRASIAGAAPAGSGEVDGVAVTNIDISTDLVALLAEPTLTTDERTTISDALGVLSGQGYLGTAARVSIDGEGYIRQVQSVAYFEDGGTVVFEATFSQFGCEAGSDRGLCVGRR